MVRTDLQILPLAFANGLIQLVDATEDPFFLVGHRIDLAETLPA